jgi:hypothetical protein
VHFDFEPCVQFELQLAPQIGCNLLQQLFSLLLPNTLCYSKMYRCKQSLNLNLISVSDVDDIFGFHKTFEEAMRALTVFEALCVELGVKLKLAKKVPPTQQITLVGWSFDSVKHTISLPKKKRLKIISLSREFLLLKSLSLLQLQVLGGNLNHAAVVIPGASLRLQWAGRAAGIAFHKGSYTLSEYDRRQLYWWITQLLDNSVMIRITPASLRPVCNIYSDSSDFYGGSLCSNGSWTSYMWSSFWLPMNIFTKELVAFITAVVSADCPQGSLIRGFIDNSNAWSCLALHRSSNHHLKTLVLNW